ncbi:hypothetical protein V5O48_007933 [Marasmius crinis-equi]|uniref:Uncharacterized protein n=1 Tax=Marasmius crinis-equi TaxID=585013 RepID=A0ABR3FG02_9AGAR
MPFNTAALRIGLYFALSLFAIVLLGLCAARINYTTNLPAGDPLNGGVHFYDPIVAELLATSILTMLWSWFITTAPPQAPTPTPAGATFPPAASLNNAESSPPSSPSPGSTGPPSPSS